ncbi:MAG: linear amide C-N hydrolase [Alphaproteobacteria bacterium]|nr:linear amide C-N hydrolase [Alphaproteobacteria bacterium]
MKKISKLSFGALLTGLFSLENQATACSDVFINKGEYHIEARTLDFLVNIAFENRAGVIGTENKTDVVIDADKIPEEKLTVWKNKYGYFGRSAFNGTKIVDGMNTQGLSVAILYLPGAKFPVYDPKDERKVLSAYDVASFILGQAATVAEGVHLLRSHQLVQSAAQTENGIFIKDIPIHYVMRDKTGDSAVVEFIDGQVKIYEKAGDIITNAPSFDWQLKNAAHYDSLLATNAGPNEEFSKTVYDYNEIYESSKHKGEANLLGMLGDYTPPSRFARARVLLNNLPDPTTRTVALAQASALNDSLSVPPLKGAALTIWSTIKDLDEGIFYTKNMLLFQGDRSLYAFPITSGYTPYDLKTMNFNAPDPALAEISVTPTPGDKIKKIISVDSVKVTGAGG